MYIPMWKTSVDIQFLSFRAEIANICVLLPLFGLTWVFGIFSVDEDAVIFQYLFAILNSLQVF